MNVLSQLDLTSGQTWMIWSVRLSVIFYLLRLFLFLRNGTLQEWRARVPSTTELLLWTSGCVCYIAHVALAFEYEHHWSHQSALQHTAEETARVTGIARGEGVWVNYLFTIIWVADVARLSVARIRNKPTWKRIDLGVQFFFAFIVFNATVVFGPTLYRILAVPIGLALYLATRPKPHARHSGS